MTFAISSVTIRSDGWSADVVLSGQAGQQGNVAYDFGTPGDTTTSKFYLTVVSEGFDSNGNLGTTTRTVYATKTIRKPSPNEASLDETDSAGDLVVRVALSDYIYADDKNGGAGTSGTDPVAVIADGAFAVGANTSISFNANATNNSTVAYPVPFGQWAMTPFQRFDDQTAHLAFTPRHRHGIARCRLKVSKGIASKAGDGVPVKRLRSSGLYGVDYEVDITFIATMTDGAATANARVWPTVGDTYFDTSSNAQTDDNIALGICDYPHYNNKTGGVQVIRYVDGTNGNDTTGDGLTMATAWATLEKAIDDGNADEIIVANGTYSLSPSTVPSDLGRWRTIQPDTGASVTVQLSGATKYKAPHLHLKNINLQRTGSNTWFDGEVDTRWLWIDNCTTDNNGVSNAIVSAFAYRSACAFITDTTIDDAHAWGMDANFAARIIHWLDGNTFNTPSSAVRIVGGVRAVANLGENIGYPTTDIFNNTAPVADPCIFEFNHFHSFDHASATQCEMFQSVNCTQGLSFIGNILERKSGTNPVLQISADSSTTTTRHVILAHNTMAGERQNLAYNDTGTIAYAQDLWRVVGNAMNNYNVKTDTFGTPSGNRIGNWPVVYGVGFDANGSEFTLGFENEYQGLHSEGMMPDKSDTTQLLNANYADDASADGTGLGNGDYTPQTGSELLNALPSGVALVDFDLFGKAVVDTVGAIQFVSAPTGGGSRIRSRIRNRRIR